MSPEIIVQDHLNRVVHAIYAEDYKSFARNVPFPLCYVSRRRMVLHDRPQWLRDRFDAYRARMWVSGASRVRQTLVHSQLHEDCLISGRFRTEFFSGSPPVALPFETNIVLSRQLGTWRSVLLSALQPDEAWPRALSTRRGAPAA